MILDTNAVSASLGEDRELLRVVSGRGLFHLPVIVLGEYRFGLGSSRRFERLGQLLDELESFSEVLPIDAGTVRPDATIRRNLHAAGTPIPQNDAWIGALAMQHRLPIVSRDVHFDAISGIERVSW